MKKKLAIMCSASFLCAAGIGSLSGAEVTLSDADVAAEKSIAELRTWLNNEKTPPLTHAFLVAMCHSNFTFRNIAYIREEKSKPGGNAEFLASCPFINSNKYTIETKHPDLTVSGENHVYKFTLKEIGRLWNGANKEVEIHFRTLGTDLVPAITESEFLYADKMFKHYRSMPNPCIHEPDKSRCEFFGQVLKWKKSGKNQSEPELINQPVASPSPQQTVAVQQAVAVPPTAPSPEVKPSPMEKVDPSWTPEQLAQYDAALKEKEIQRRIAEIDAKQQEDQRRRGNNPEEGK